MHPKYPRAKRTTTSWESVGKWYHGLVGEEGHYYHRQIIIPGVLRLMEKGDSLLDLACGNGVLARHLPEGMNYLGVDASSSLIKAAKEQCVGKDFLLGDIVKPLALPRRDFSHATLILAAQNLTAPDHAMRNAHLHLRAGGKFILVLNHPCFRIPRQSSWGIDQDKKIQYRRIDRYHSSMKIPIQMHPGQKKSTETWSFHHPLASYSQWLNEAGFDIESMEEWYSDKVSTGAAARMENRSREEIPLFLAIRSKKR
ncbi:MAG: class I SAM-dependent methyltransferase [Parachlamydia sp.]|nr:class I SAM-dependent methyltransferase [Parachlamydia sp.]